MPNFLNRVKMTTATTGTGTLTLGSAVSTFRSFATAGAVNAAVYSYLIQEGTAWEVGRGVYTTSGTTLSRVLVESSTGSLISLAGAATVAQIAAAHDLKFMGARVYSAADLTAQNASAFMTIPFDSESVDTNAFHDTVTNNGRLTIPSGLGINYVDVVANSFVSLDTADTYGALGIRRNGTDTIAAQYFEKGTTDFRASAVALSVPVVAGDYFEARLGTESDISVTIVGGAGNLGTTFSIRVVG